MIIEKPRFQNVLLKHENENSAFPNSFSLKSVFEKLRFRDGLVWTVGLTDKFHKVTSSEKLSS